MRLDSRTNVVFHAFWLAMLAGALLFLTNGAGAQAANDLYRARTIVTGQREETRGPGIEKCLDDVVVKASGDPALIAKQGYAGIAKQASSFVAAYHYRDRMEGLPVGDEQGTRDRPYFLTVDFDAAAIKQIVERLGGQVWEGLRPRLAVFLAVQNGAFITAAKRIAGKSAVSTSTPPSEML